MKIRLHNYFLTSGVRRVATFAGLLALAYGYITYESIDYAVLFACIVILASGIILPFVFYFRDFPYLKMLNKIQDRYLFVSKINIFGKSGTFMKGMLALTNDKLYLLSRSHGGHSLSLEKNKVPKVHFEKKDRTIVLHVTEEKIVKIASPDTLRIYMMMEYLGWNSENIEDKEDFS